MTHVQEGLNENSSFGKNISRGFKNIWMPFGPSRQRFINFCQVRGIKMSNLLSILEKRNLMYDTLTIFQNGATFKLK
jgi:hypothetical protein